MVSTRNINQEDQTLYKDSIVIKPKLGQWYRLRNPQEHTYWVWAYRVISFYCRYSQFRANPTVYTRLERIEYPGACLETIDIREPLDIATAFEPITEAQLLLEIL